MTIFEIALIFSYLRRHILAFLVYLLNLNEAFISVDGAYIKYHNYQIAKTNPQFITSLLRKWTWPILLLNLLVKVILHLQLCTESTTEISCTPPTTC